jgi:hypothetical protein
MCERGDRWLFERRMLFGFDDGPADGYPILLGEILQMLDEIGCRVDEIL